MKKLHNLVLLLSTLSGIFLSCRKQAVDDQKNKPNIDTVSVTNKIMIPVKFSSDKYILSFEYQAGTTKLIRISHSDKSYILITYAAKYHRVERYKDNVVYHYDDFILTAGRTTKIHSFDSFGRVDTPTGHSTLEYNTTGQLVNIKDYDASKILLKDRVITYAASGNALVLTTTDQLSKTSVFDYTSDNKNGIFKHVMYAREIFLIMPYSFLFPDANNRLSCRSALEPQQNVTYSYVYNTQSYPSQIVIDGPEGKQTFDITYADVAD